MTGTHVKRVVLAGSIVLWIALFARVWNGVGTTQWDFKAYYTAVKVYEQGEDPYNVENLRKLGSRILPFHYPLWTVHALKPVVALNYNDAHRLWVLLKAAALVLLLLVWKRSFLTGVGWWLILPVALLAFGGATVWDLNAGNITVFEQLLLWTGFAFLLRSQVARFVLFVTLAAAIKQLPTAFLLLVLLPGVRSRRTLVAGAAGVLAVLAFTFLPFVFEPEFFERYLRGLTHSQPRLFSNPCIAGIADELVAYFPVLEPVRWMKWVVLAGWWGLVLATSRNWLRRVWTQGSRAEQIMVAALLYMLLAPRLVVYGYMLAIVPALALVLPALARTGASAAVGAVALCAGGFAAMQFGAGNFLNDAMPFLLLVACWLVVMHAGVAERAPGARQRPA